MNQGIIELGEALARLGYDFTTCTPATHKLQNARPGNEVAKSIRDVFGWSRPFDPALLPPQLFDAMRAAEACEPISGSELWRPTFRFSTLEGVLFAHSAHPTDDENAVFFGPDTYRFVRALKQYASRAERIVDVGCGAGVGGIVLAALGLSTAPVVLADINGAALRLSRVNASLAGVKAEVVRSDVLDGVSGNFDLVVSNPPYLVDRQRRVYRDGAGEFGEGLGVRIVRQTLERLRGMPGGGRLLLYTGSAIVAGRDTFFRAIASDLQASGVFYEYEELDPDVFSEELTQPAYVTVERIAAVLLRLRVAGAHRTG